MGQANPLAAVLPLRSGKSQRAVAQLLLRKGDTMTEVSKEATFLIAVSWQAKVIAEERE